MGIGDWGLGIGDWGLGVGPNPQSPIPHPPILYYYIFSIYSYFINIIYKYYLEGRLLRNRKTVQIIKNKILFSFMLYIKIMKYDF